MNMQETQGGEQPQQSPEEQLLGVSRAISTWGLNLEKVNEGAESDGNTKSKIIKAVEELQGITLNEEQQQALDEIKEMNLSTGIDTNRIQELAKKFKPAEEVDKSSSSTM